jgi:hypothetical protein
LLPAHYMCWLCIWKVRRSVGGGSLDISSSSI